MAKKESFESSLGKLEKIVEKLEDGGVSLEESIRLFEEGRKHAKVCAKQLNSVERKIQLLMQDESGELKTAPFEDEESDEESASAPGMAKNDLDE